VSTPRSVSGPLPAGRGIAGIGVLDDAWLRATALEVEGRDAVPELVRVDPHRKDDLCLEVRLRVGTKAPHTSFWIVSRPDAIGSAVALRRAHSPGEDRRLSMPDASMRSSELRAQLESAAGALSDFGVDASDDAGDWSTRVLSHRPGRRAAIRFARGDRAVVVKILRGDRAELLARRIGGALAANPNLPCLPHLWSGSWPEWVFVPFAEGTTLHEGWTRVPSDERWSRVETAARALAAVHATEAPSDLDPRGPAEAVHAIDRPLGILTALGVSRVDAIRATRDRLRDAAKQVVASPPRLAHGDVHDKQFLFAGSASCWLLDWDGLAAAPPEEDRANFRAHLRLRSLQGLLSPSQSDAYEHSFREATRRLCSTEPTHAGVGTTRGPGAGRSEPPGRDAEDFYLATSLARLSAVYGLRPRWASLVGPLRDAAERILDDRWE